MIGKKQRQELEILGYSSLARIQQGKMQTLSNRMKTSRRLKILKTGIHRNLI
jgi:hypothetical protein